MHLHEVLGWPGPMTHRQFMAWMEWLESEWNRPSRSDNYLMQIAKEVENVAPRVWGEAGKATTSSKRLQFEDAPQRAGPTPEQTAKWRASIAKAAWFAATGYSP